MNAQALAGLWPLPFSRQDMQEKWPTYSLLFGLPLAYWLTRPAKKEELPTDFNSFLRQPVAEVASPAPLATSFESFLKEVPQVYLETDFESFLKKAPSTAQNIGVASQGIAKAEVSKLSADDVKVTVMFGTEYGFSKEIAEKLCSKVKEMGSFWPDLVNMADYPDGYDFSKEQAVFMACSTQGDGVPPTEARDFCEWLFNGKAPSLAHLQFSVCALGDRSYEHFCRYG